MKVAPLLALMLAAVSLAAATPHYHVVRHIAIGGEGGWDYVTVDAAAKRLYVSHSDRVNVVDLTSGHAIGEIANTPGVHGIALAPALHRGFVTAGRTNRVTVFDTATLKTVGEVKTDERPDAVLFEPATSRVFTFNAGGKNATVIDAKTEQVLGAIPLGGKPEFAQADGKGRVFVNIEDTSELAELDAASMKEVRRWKLTGCEEPSGLAIDRAHHRLFSGCDNKVMAISDAVAGKAIATMPIGEGVDGDAFDPAYGVAFSANGASGTLTVVREVSPMKFEVAQNAETARGARTIALDETTHHIYLPTAKFGPAPEPTAEHPHPRPSIVPGTFEVIELVP